MKQQTHFFKYLSLIRNVAHTYCHRWKYIPYEELVAQSMLIYVEALESYDESKSSFSTYLTWRLMTLGDYCISYSKQVDKLYLDFDDSGMFEDYLNNKPKNPTLAELLEYSYYELSKDAYAVYKWMLERSWEGKHKKKPSILLATKVFHKTRNQMESIWAEIRNFYKNDSIFHINYDFGHIIY